MATVAVFSFTVPHIPMGLLVNHTDSRASVSPQCPWPYSDLHLLQVQKAKFRPPLDGTATGFLGQFEGLACRWLCVGGTESHGHWQSFPMQLGSLKTCLLPVQPMVLTYPLVWVLVANFQEFCKQVFKHTSCKTDILKTLWNTQILSPPNEIWVSLLLHAPGSLLSLISPWAMTIKPW